MVSTPEARPNDVLVERDARSGDIDYSIAAGDCRIVWTAFRSETNRGVIRHRADCGLPLSGQAPVIEKLLRMAILKEAGTAGLRTLDWGRLYPDGARDATMPVRLALAAKKSADWDSIRGRPRSGDVNGWVRTLANKASIYHELLPVFRNCGLEIQLAAVEKVLVLPAAKLPFYEELRADGVQGSDRVPFDCQAWFSVRPTGGPPR